MITHEVIYVALGWLESAVTAIVTMIMGAASQHLKYCYKT